MSVDNATIIRKTGLDRKKLTNALSQLKKTGKIKSVKRGVHKIV
jgi:predicted transcriptional regulator of viral defense system